MRDTPSRTGVCTVTLSGLRAHRCECFLVREEVNFVDYFFDGLVHTPSTRKVNVAAGWVREDEPDLTEPSADGDDGGAVVVTD